MFRGRGWRAWFGVSALLAVLAVGNVSAAMAASSGLEFDPPAYDFGPVPYGSGPTEPHEVTLTNTGETQLEIKRWRYRWLAYWTGAPDPFGTASSDCHVLEPGESCSMGIVFNPIHPGPAEGWEMVRSQDEEEPWAELELTGEGTGPWIPVTPQHLAFESVGVGATSTPQTITVESQDFEKVKIEDISITSVDGWPLASTPFRIVGGSCHEGESLAPGKTCTIEVAMTPTAAGLFQAKLEITDAAPGSPQAVEVEGTATALPVDQSAASQPPVAAPPRHPKRVCPKGKQKVVKKGRRLCIKKRRHHRHPAHSR